MSLGESTGSPAGPVVSVPSGIARFEWSIPEGRLSWDEAATPMFAARPGEPALEAWRRRVHPDDRQRVQGRFAEPDCGEELFRLVLDDGSLRHVLARVTQVVKDAQGRPVTIAGLLLDVTESHESSLRVLALLDSVSDGFCALDSSLRCTYLNRRAEQILGLPREQMLHRQLWEVFPHAVGTVFEEVYTRVLRTGAAESFEAFYPEPLNIWMEVRAQPSADGLLLYFQDGTATRAQRVEREQLLAAERTAREDAERARADTERALKLVAHQATHDALTGLVNRQEFARIAEEAIKAPGARSATVMFIDLDRFKLVNDSLGHAAGDALLVSVARRLRQVLPPGYPLARLGGDEFVVLLTDTGEEEAPALAEQVLAGLREPLDVCGRSVTTSASIGLAPVTLGTTVETLLRDADVALYRAKDNGRDQAAWFDRTAHEELMQRVTLEGDLRAALERDELTLYFQPMYDATSDRLVGVEALSRWRHPTLGDVSPGLFIPLAEDTGLMRALGARVIAMACEQAARWASIPDFTIWVNVSARQLDTPGLAAALLAELERTGVTADRIGVEVTESVFSDDRSAAVELTMLAEAGVRIAIDDFGTGHSSLARLYRFPIDVLKIDQSFVHDIETNRGLAAVRAVVQLTEALGLSTVAEGIETPRQLQLVREAGCHVGAGYLLGRPAPADELTPVLLGA